MDRKGNKRQLYQSMAWLLVFIFIATCFMPSEFVLAARKTNWYVDYLAEVDGEVIEADGNQVTFIVEEDQEVKFLMEVVEGPKKDFDRFQERVNITMDSYLHQLVIKDGEEPIEWPRTMASETGYLLEEVGLASSSNAKATSSNGTKVTVSDATDSDSKNSYTKIQLQFAEDLRKEEEPETIEVEITETEFGFTAPEGMIISCVQDGYDYKITSVPMATMSNGLMKLSAELGNWNLDWKVTVAGNEIIEGDSVTVGIGQEVVVSLVISPATSGLTQFEDVFTVKINENLYQLITDGGTELISWPESTYAPSGNLFADPGSGEVVGEGEEAVRVFYLEFDEYFKANPNVSVISANCSFSYIAMEETLIEYEWNENELSFELKSSDEEYVYVPPNIGFKKELIATLNENSVRYGNNVIAEKGDYVFYRIRINPWDGSEVSHIFAEHTIFDAFDGRVFDFVDLSEDSESAAVKALVDTLYANKSLSSTQYAEMSNFFSMPPYKPWVSWDDVTESELPPTLADAISAMPNLLLYTNQDSLEIGKNANDCMYICLQIKEDASESGSLSNHAYLVYGEQECYDAAAPGTSSYYDAAIQISGASVFREQAASPILNIGSSPSDNYPNVLNNANAAVMNGDYITFQISAYGTQGSEVANIKEVSIYVPMGLTLVEPDSLPDSFGYGKNKWDNISGTAAKAYPHVMPDYVGDEGFVDNDYYDGYQLGDYAKLYQVSKYKYTFTTTESEPVIYVTCKVNSIEALLASEEFKDIDISTSDAAFLLYLISAEVSGITDANGNNVLDVDSWIDDNPFNDWYYYNEATSRYELKNESLYLYDPWYVSGEKDNDISMHVRDQSGVFLESEVNPKNDEDDFDYAVVYPIDLDSTDVEFVAKDVEPGFGAAIEYLLPTIQQLNGEEYTLLPDDGNVSSIGTIVPYVVYINRYGTEIMNQVTFEDTLPDSMEFLTVGGEPLVYIGENIETDGIRYQSSNSASGSIIINSDLVVVKDVYLPTYITGAEGTVDERCYKPSGIDANGNWVYSCENNKLTIDFGDIDDNSFAVVYYAVVRKLTPTYKNTATITWAGGEKEVSNLVPYREHSNGSILHGKTVSATGEEGTYQREINLDSTEFGDGSDITLYYKLYVNVTVGEGFTGYPADVFLFEDDIADPLGEGVTPVFDRITNLVETSDYTYQEVETSNSSFAVTADTNKLVIKNSEAITASTSTYIYFHVTYSQLPRGSRIDNYFGVTTNVKTPLKLSLTKLDGYHVENRLGNAEFTLSYLSTYDESKLVLDDNQDPIAFRTDYNGTAETLFFIDEAKAEILTTDNQTDYCLYLLETNPPPGYSSLEAAYYKLVIRKDDAGQYRILSVHGYNKNDTQLEDTDYVEVIGGSGTGEIAITIKNYEAVLLPAAGGIGTSYFTIAGMILLGFSLLMYSYHQRRIKSTIH